MAISDGNEDAMNGGFVAQMRSEICEDSGGRRPYRSLHRSLI
jgi:hypothetical protein